jgi:predicted Rossmann fold nucleotide-binding protein DprA/Smf involved in DNA uptake
MLATHVLSHDTQAILLLCGRFGHAGENGANPLKPAEYADLAQWLHARGLRPADLLTAGVSGALGEAPVEASRLQGLLDRGSALGLAVESWTNRGLWVISRGDEAYPRRLKTALGRHAPPILYGAGEVTLLTRGGLAVVGSRAADETALGFAREVAGACAQHDIQVVSGGARGVDSEAMLAALQAGGSVVGMLADSLSKQAVAGRYRAPLLEERLVLVSPYDPASGFSVGNAMGRNKHVYALADWALVVSTALGEGGTWAGAVEALELGKTPVYVRMPQPPPAAHEALLKRGARPFPARPWDDLSTVLSHADVPAVATSSGDTPAGHEAAVRPTPSPRQDEREADSSWQAEKATEDTAGDVSARRSAGAAAVRQGAEDVGETVRAASLYGTVLPLLLSQLSEPRDVQSLAKELEVVPRQLQDWLDRAVADGLITRSKRPVRYVARASQRELFPMDSTA